MITAVVAGAVAAADAAPAFALAVGTATPAFATATAAAAAVAIAAPTARRAELYNGSREGRVAFRPRHTGRGVAGAERSIAAVAAAAATTTPAVAIAACRVRHAEPCAGNCESRGTSPPRHTRMGVAGGVMGIAAVAADGAAAGTSAVAAAAATAAPTIRRAAPCDGHCDGRATPPTHHMRGGTAGVVMITAAIAISVSALVAVVATTPGANAVPTVRRAVPCDGNRFFRGIPPSPQPARRALAGAHGSGEHLRRGPHDRPVRLGR